VLFAVSANVSYQHAEEDVELFTGIQVAAKTQQLVHRQTFEMPEVKQFVEELSVDGVRFASALPKGTLHLARIQGVRLHDLEAIRAYFQDNDALIEWVNHQLASPITCLGDGHDGVWNIIDEMPLTVNVGKLVSLNGEFAQGGWVIEAFEAS